MFLSPPLVLLNIFPQQFLICFGGRGGLFWGFVGQGLCAGGEDRGPLLLREYIKQHQGEGEGKHFSKIEYLARLPPKLGPDGLGTLIGGSGVKFRVGLHPPEVGRP